MGRLLWGWVAGAGRSRGIVGSLLAVPTTGAVLLLYAGFLRRPANHPRTFLRGGRRAADGTLVVCAGDSLTRATASADWVALLRERLGDRGYEFVNAGVNGDTARGLLRRLGDDVIACEPDAVAVLIGTNDAREGAGGRDPGGAAEGSFRDDLGAILARLREHMGARVAVLSVPPLGEDPRSEANGRVARYNAAVREAAAAHGASYLPLHEGLTALAGPPRFRAPFGLRLDLLLGSVVRHYALRESWDEIAERNGLVALTDGIHLSDQGAAVAADLVSGWLSPLAKETHEAGGRRRTAEDGRGEGENVTRTPSERKLPWGLGPANRVVVALQSLGLAFGPMRLLSVPGRRSGEMRTTPVSPVAVGGERYVAAVFEGADWVKNARAAGWGVLARGRRQERVAFVELPPEERASVLRQLPREAPQAALFFGQRYGVTRTPEAFAALAPRCSMFRVVRDGPTG